MVRRGASNPDLWMNGPASYFIAMNREDKKGNIEKTYQRREKESIATLIDIGATEMYNQIHNPNHIKPI